MQVGRDNARLDALRGAVFFLINCGKHKATTVAPSSPSDRHSLFPCDFRKLRAIHDENDGTSEALKTS